MRGFEHDLELLAIERHVMQPFVGTKLRQREDRDIELSAGEALLQRGGGGVEDVQFDAGMARAHRRNEIEQMGRCNRAHQPEPQRRLLQPHEFLRLALGVLGAAVDLLQIGLERAAELGEMRVGALAVKQRTAQLFFELLDGARQRGLRDVAALGRAGEVQFLAEAEEIADLMHFHERVRVR